MRYFEQKDRKCVETHKKLGLETKTKILSMIAESEPAGMTTDDFVKATELIGGRSMLFAKNTRMTIS